MTVTGGLGNVPEGIVEEITLLRERVSALESLTAVKANHAAGLRSVEMKVDAATQKLSQLSVLVEGIPGDPRSFGIRTELILLNTRVDTLGRRVDELKSEVAALRVEVSTKMESIDAALRSEMREGFKRISDRGFTVQQTLAAGGMALAAALPAVLLSQFLENRDWPSGERRSTRSHVSFVVTAPVRR